MGGAQPGDRLVLDANDTSRQIGRRKVEELARMHADHVNIDPLAVHLGEPAAERCRVDRHRASGQRGHRPIHLRQVADERPDLADIHMAVHVDGANGASPDNHAPAFGHRLRGPDDGAAETAGTEAHACRGQRAKKGAAVGAHRRVYYNALG